MQVAALVPDTACCAFIGKKTFSTSQNDLALSLGLEEEVIHKPVAPMTEQPLMKMSIKMGGVFVWGKHESRLSM